MSDVNLIDEQITISLGLGPTGATGPSGAAAITATIDMTATGDTTIYTVPADKIFIPTNIKLLTKTLTLDGVDATISYLAEAVVLRAAFQTTAAAVNFVEKSTNINDNSKQGAYVAGDIIKATVSIAATHSVHTVTAILAGNLYDA
jgi:hypothetical protein